MSIQSVTIPAFYQTQYLPLNEEVLKKKLESKLREES